MPLTAVAIAVSAFMAPTPIVESPVFAPQAQTVKEYVETSFADAPIMVEIARCESQFKQFTKKGAVVKNPHSTAIGLFQIMSSLHKETAAKMGMDITTVEGNTAYARYLYENEGTKPWNASKACWGKTQVAKAAN